METAILRVGGMSCGHCVRAVENAATALPGVSAAAADLAKGTATVTYDPAACSLTAIKAAIEAEGYEVTT